MRIRVIDLETSSDDETGRICEIGWCDVWSTLGDLLERPTGWQTGNPHSLLVNPCQPITAKASSIHHIIDEDVRNAPLIDDAWKFASTPPEGDRIDLNAAHSAKFERRLITDEMTGGKDWLCTYKIALRLWPEELSHGNM